MPNATDVAGPAGAAYAELHCHSFYSLLDAASAPEALVQAAVEQGLAGLALTDHDNLSGAVRFSVAARRAGLHAIYGAEVTLAGGAHLTLLAETQAGYANLCRLLTAARAPATAPAAEAEQTAWLGKAAPALAWETLTAHTRGLIALSGCRQGEVAAALLRGQEETARHALQRLYALFGAQQLFVEVQHHALPDDDRLLRRLATLARRLRLPLVATHNVHYARPADGMVRDALIAVRHQETLAAAQRAGRFPHNHTCTAYALDSARGNAVSRSEILDAQQSQRDSAKAEIVEAHNRLETFEEQIAGKNEPTAHSSVFNGTGDPGDSTEKPKPTPENRRPPRTSRSKKVRQDDFNDLVFRTVFGDDDGSKR